MLRNGRKERAREEKVANIVSAITAIYLILLFLIPVLLATNTVPELSGRANRIDYATVEGWGSWGNQNDGLNEDIGQNQEVFGYFSWSELNPIAAFVYAFGDLNCHQKSERSWEINGNQLAVCVRDVGLFLGLFVGAIFWRYRGLNRWTVRDSLLSVCEDENITFLYENDRRMIAMIFFLTIGALPIGFDGSYQLLTDYESTNPIRLITGTIAGFVLSWWFCAAVSSKTQDFTDSSQVKLPANARLVFKD